MLYSSKNIMKNLSNVESMPLAPADVFVIFRDELKESGVPVKELKPASILEPLLLEYKGIIIREVDKIAPGILPSVVIEETLIQKSGAWLILVGLGMALINSFFKYSIILSGSFILFTCGFILIILTSRMKPLSITLGDLETVDDLCILISISTIYTNK